MLERFCTRNLCPGMSFKPNVGKSVSRVKKRHLPENFNKFGAHLNCLCHPVGVGGHDQCSVDLHSV
jgi:hypothetical protein